jgi:hypothetical protein
VHSDTHKSICKYWNKYLINTARIIWK